MPNAQCTLFHNQIIALPLAMHTTSWKKKRKTTMMKRNRPKRTAMTVPSHHQRRQLVANNWNDIPKIDNAPTLFVAIQSLHYSLYKWKKDSLMGSQGWEGGCFLKRKWIVAVRIALWDHILLFIYLSTSLFQ